ncbi:hypothetical protein GCM10023205_47560 [Yinghuangia aomiensis]|uniref:Uncharacterized protein n=2 Tax=Yinghuangia aomiensis TaxID=676205 RepID=A0ABP9HPJ3_9ACTN
MSRIRLAALVVAMALGMGLLTSCTVPEGAVTGVGVAADGAPMVFVAVCKGRIDAAVLHEEGDATPEAHTHWQHAGAVKDFAAWPFAGNAEWSVDRSPLLSPGHAYTLYGATHDNTWSGVHVRFSFDDLAALSVDQVRYSPWRDVNSVVTTSVAEFRAHACDQRKK